MAERRLRISDDLALPLEFATEGVAVIGKRGSGKSNTEARFVEVLYEAGVPFAVVDPKGDWYGLKSSRDGKTAGLSVPVFGGLYGDFPLDERTGARIADLLVDEMVSAVLDVSHLSKTGGLPTFLTAFCNQLMHRHQLEPHVRTVILEEAHRYIPQSVTGKTAALKEAAASLLLEGRAFGLGCWAATQRPARLHKDVLEEVGTAIIHAIGVSATNDKRTIAGWVDHHDISKEIVDSLTVLRPGEAWVLIPQDGLVQRVQMQRRTTFDSAATPKVGQAPRRPSTMADIDQAAITRALEDVIQKAKRDDPKELRRRIVELEREAADRPAEQIVETVVERVEVPVLNGQVADLKEIVRELVDVGQTISDVGGRIIAAIDRVASDTPQMGRAKVAPRGVPAQPDRGRGVSAVAAPPSRAASPAPAPSRPLVEGEARAVSKAQRAFLTVLAQFPEGRTKIQAAVLAGYAPSVSTTRNNLSALRTAGLITGMGGAGDPLRITNDGLDVLGGDYEELPTGPALIDWWVGRLPAAQSRFLRALCDAYPDSLTKEEAAQRAGYDPDVSTTRNNLSALRTLGLIVGINPIRASEDLF